jgi:hypothetical protein
MRFFVARTGRPTSYLNAFDRRVLRLEGVVRPEDLAHASTTATSERTSITRLTPTLTVRTRVVEPWNGRDCEQEGGICLNAPALNVDTNL